MNNKISYYISNIYKNIFQKLKVTYTCDKKINNQNLKKKDLILMDILKLNAKN